MDCELFESYSTKMWIHDCEVWFVVLPVTVLEFTALLVTLLTLHLHMTWYYERGKPFTCQWQQAVKEK